MIHRVITLNHQTTYGPEGQDDVSYPEELVELFLDEFTQPGDIVFDPFAGFGTTLVVAERMRRRPLGVELLPERVGFIRPRLADPSAIIEGDARQLHSFLLPPLDFVITSPPYMNMVDHPQNPLTAYQTLDGDYAGYIEQLAAVFRMLTTLLKPDARAVVNVANIRTGNILTPLATDVARALASMMTLEQRVKIVSAVADPAIEDNYCFVFRKV